MVIIILLPIKVEGVRESETVVTDVLRYTLALYHHKMSLYEVRHKWKAHIISVSLYVYLELMNFNECRYYH